MRQKYWNWTAQARQIVEHEFFPFLGVTGAAALVVSLSMQAIWPHFWFATCLCAYLAEWMCLRLTQTNYARAKLLGVAAIALSVLRGAVFAYLPAALWLQGEVWAVVTAAVLILSGAYVTADRFTASMLGGLAAWAPLAVAAVAGPVLAAFLFGLGDGHEALLSSAGLLMGIGLIHRETIAKAVAVNAARAAEHQARQQAHFVSLLNDQEGRLAAVYDREGRFLAWNRGVQAFAPGQNLQGRGLFDESQEAAKAWRHMMERAVQGESFSGEADRICEAVGDMNYYSWRFEPWYTEAGDIGGAMFVGDAVTDLIEAQREVENTAHILRMALRAGGAAVWRLDMIDETIWTSDNYEALFGASGDFHNFMQHQPTWCTEEDLPRLMELRRQLSERGFGVVEHRLAHMPHVWVQSACDVVMDKDGQARWVIGLTRDISQQKMLVSHILEATRQAESALSEKRRILSAVWADLDIQADVAEHAEVDAGEHAPSVDLEELAARFNAVIDELHARDGAMERAIAQLRLARETAHEANLAKSQFLANMSHELRTPLNAIIGYSEMMLEESDAAQDEMTAKDLNRILSASRHLLALINEILDLSKIEAGAMEVSSRPFDPLELCNEVLETVRPMAMKNANALRLVDDAQLGGAETDEFRIRQCLLNLLSNACKFTKEGAVTLRVRRVRDNAFDWLVFDVSDTGIGISPAQLERVFEPFSQADATTTRKFGGTGLGLSITRRLAELLGGDLSVASTLGKGSTFTLRIPAVYRAKEEAEIEDADGAIAAEGPRILVIDDHQDARELARRALGRLGFHVQTCTTAQDGLDAIAERQPALIVLDIHLPDRSGWDVLRALRDDEATRGIPVLVASINDDRGRSMSLGACQHLVKPIDRDAFAAAVLQFARSMPSAALQGANALAQAAAARAKSR
ncbi:MAG: response regulator [Alphaproteobacteria bacterium]|nr:response regulator [Alphaproteobacteria bacterium]